MSAKFPRERGGAGPFSAISLFKQLVTSQLLLEHFKNVSTYSSTVPQYSFPGINSIPFILGFKILFKKIFTKYYFTIMNEKNIKLVQNFF